MICFEVSRNGRKLCTAGVGDFGVLSAVVTWVSHPPEKLARWKKEMRRRIEPVKIDVSVGGMKGGNASSSEHLRWVDCDLDVGDEIRVRLVDLPAAEQPRTRHRDDPAKDLERRKTYVRQMAKELGWTITATREKPKKGLRQPRNKDPRR